MARPRSRKERWRDLARSIARQNDLPAGCRLILRNGRTGRMVRDDVVLNHLSLGQALADAEPVSALYDQIRSICLTRLAERGWEPVLLGPGGQACDAKSMGEVRAMPPADPGRRRPREGGLDLPALASEIEAFLADLQRGRAADCGDLARADVRAMLSLCGLDPLRKALAAESSS